MVDFKAFLSTDHFKIGHFGDKHVKGINIALFVSSIIAVLTVIFYLIMFSFTNFNSLDDLQDYSTNYAGEDKALSDINMAAKIMPSYNYKKNAIWMNKTRDVNDTIIPNAESIMADLELNNTYLTIEKTKHFFPKFKFTEDNIPIGDSITMCISLHWAPEDKGKNFDLTSQVTNFPVCKEAASGKFIWNTDDPTTGIDVPVWTQKEIDIDCTDQEDCVNACSEFNALYLNGRKGKKCYTYKILESICIAVAWDETQQQFAFKGGCFENGIHYSMTDPVKEKTYHFSHIKFEVRNSKDPVIKAGELSGYTYSYGASMDGVSIMLNVLFFGALLTIGVCVGLIFYYKAQNKKSLNMENAENENDKDKELQDAI